MTGGAELWKPEHRRAAARHGLRYPSDLTDAEWVLVEPMITPAKRGGRRREVNVREVLNAIFYVLSTGCQWQALPKDLPPKSTAHSYFMLWDWVHWSASTTHFMSRARGPGSQPNCRDHRQSKRQSGSKRGSTLDLQGFDAAKKVTGRKRHILVDTLGLLLNVVVHSAAMQDRDGALRPQSAHAPVLPLHQVYLR
jgi:transposase